MQEAANAAGIPDTVSRATGSLEERNDSVEPFRNHAHAGRSSDGPRHRLLRLAELDAELLQRGGHTPEPDF